MWRGWSGAKLYLSQNGRVRMRRPECDPPIFEKHPPTAWRDIHPSTPLGQSYHSGRENAYFESGVVTGHGRGLSRPPNILGPRDQKA